MSLSRNDATSQEEINKSLAEIDDVPEESLVQQLLIHPNEFPATNNQSLRREYEALYYSPNRNQENIAKMRQILEELRLGNNLDRTMSDSDLSEDFVKENEPKDIVIPQYQTNVIIPQLDPFSTVIAKILKIRESEGRPMAFSLMTESQMEREKHVIKNELHQLKNYSKSNGDVSIFTQ
jgi:hypothetical protein